MSSRTETATGSFNIRAAQELPAQQTDIGSEQFVTAVIDEITIRNPDGSLWPIGPMVRQRCQEIIGLANETRQALGLPPLTNSEVRIILHELVYTAWLHRDHKRKNGTDYFDVHLAGTVLHVIRELHLTSPLSLIAAAKHDDLEDISGIQKERIMYKPSTRQELNETTTPRSRQNRLSVKQAIPKTDSSDTTIPLFNPHVPALPDISSEEVTTLRLSIQRIITGMTKEKLGGHEEVKELAFQRLLGTMCNYGVRVGYIKVGGDRRHNMSTLDGLMKKGTDEPDTKRQMEVAQETMDVYVPLAQIFRIRETEEYLVRDCARYLNNTLREQYEAFIQEKRQKFIAPHEENIRAGLRDVGDLIHTVQFRAKGLSRLLRKARPDIPFEQLVLDDLLPFQPLDEYEPFHTIDIITHAPDTIEKVQSKIIKQFSLSRNYNTEELGEMRGVLLKVFNPSVGGRLYFRVNDLQSEMRSQRGILANLMTDEAPPGMEQLFRDIMDIARRTRRNILEVAREMLVFPRIKVYTPEGKEVDLPREACSLDFARTIHSDLLTGAQEAYLADDLWGDNPRQVSLFAPLPHGAVVKVATQLPKKRDGQVHAGERIQPELGWLFFAQTSDTRQKIRRYIRQKEDQHESQEERLYKVIAEVLSISRTHLDRFLAKLNPHFAQGHNLVKCILDDNLDLLQALSQMFPEIHDWQMAIKLPHIPGSLESFMRMMKSMANAEEIHSIGEDADRKLIYFGLAMHRNKVTVKDFLRFVLRLAYDGYDLQVMPMDMREPKT